MQAFYFFIAQFNSIQLIKSFHDELRTSIRKSMPIWQNICWTWTPSHLKSVIDQNKTQGNQPNTHLRMGWRDHEQSNQWKRNIHCQKQSNQWNDLWVRSQQMEKWSSIRHHQNEKSQLFCALIIHRLQSQGNPQLRRRLIKLEKERKWNLCDPGILLKWKSQEIDSRGRMELRYSGQRHCGEWIRQKRPQFG